MEAKLERVRAGETTFDAFVRETQLEWNAMAVALMRKCRFRGQRLPASLLLGDVVQEMLLAAWEALQGYDPSKGPTLQTHVVWRAHSAGKRFIDGQRGLRVGVAGNAMRQGRCFVTVSDVDTKWTRTHAANHGMTSIVDRVSSDAHIEETLDLMQLARAEHERRVLRGLLADEPHHEIALAAFGSAERATARVTTTALVCLSRRSA